LLPRACEASYTPRLCGIHKHHRAVEQIRVRLGYPAQRYTYYAESHPLARARLLEAWAAKHANWKARLSAYLDHPWMHDPWHQDALCIHSHEGSWTANTGNGYYGGLQMDSGFMATYGPTFLSRYGTADRWPVADQLHAAYHAWLSRGWGPWPNTAAMCGL
jgi:hypothetical protein